MAFNIQLEFSSGRKRFAIKTMAPLERVGKNLSIWVVGFFFKDAAYDYERVKQSAFYAKKALNICRIRFKHMLLRAIK